MSSEININIPAISPELTATIETEQIALQETETQAFAALREKYAPLARHNGYIRTGYESQSTSNSQWSRTAYHLTEGKRTRGLLCYDGFDDQTNRGDQNRGTYLGSRLYLTETGEWLEITRFGSWSHWQGEGEGWTCGSVDWYNDASLDDDAFNPDDEYQTRSGGDMVTLSDERVAKDYDLEEVLTTLSKTLGDMSTKLPERLTRIRQNAKLASELLAALK